MLHLSGETFSEERVKMKIAVIKPHDGSYYRLSVKLLSLGIVKDNKLSFFVRLYCCRFVQRYCFVTK